LSSSALNFDFTKLKLPRWLMPGTPADSAVSSRAVKYPPAAIEMGVTDLVLARVVKDKAKKWSLGSYDIVEVPDGVLDGEPYMTRIRSAQTYGALVAASIQKEGVKTRAISIVLPDHLARVSILQFEELPRTRRELLDLVKWRMKKAVPFKVEDAAVDYQVMPATDSNGDPAKGYNLLAVLMPHAVVEEHESIFTRQGIHAGLVDLSTFSLMHLYKTVIAKESPLADYMLLNATPDFFTVMVQRNGQPLFYRCKAFGLTGNGGMEGAARVLKREIQASLLYYQERLHGKLLARVYMRLVGHDPRQVEEAFDRAPLGSPPEMIDVTRVLAPSGRIAALDPQRQSEMLQRLAPAIGAAWGRAS